MPQQITEVRPDPVLTNTVIQRGIGVKFLADVLFPSVDFNSDKFKYAEYGNENMADDTEDLIAIGPHKSNMVNFSQIFKTAETEKRGLLGFLADEIVANSPTPERLRRRRVTVVDDKLRIGKEKRCRDLLNDAALVANATPAIKWDAAGAVIEKDLDAAKTAFRIKAGFHPNHILIPDIVAKVIKRDPAVRELLKFTHSDLIVNGDLPPTLWNMKVLIPDALNNLAAPGAAENIADIWNQDNVILLYISPLVQDSETFTLGINARGKTLAGNMHTIVQAWRENGVDGEFYRVVRREKLVVIAYAAIYMVQNTLT